ncbi:transcription factor GTE12-like [Lycium ferocissimum]|uniref:transcription factor GTE12-like n=1 Tax=Lycium ferocissimum TaxID=112874 RepID=UPI002816717F|nr:transcription factor GTE12-like [Lycium ferocissimum]
MVNAQSPKVNSSLQLLELPTMNIGDSIVTKKLKIKISSKGVRAESGGGSEMGIKVKLPMPSDSKKRAPQLVMDNEREKRRKMDRSIKQQCSNVLKTLMAHPSGWPFLVPVDPVLYNIPDYFTIIRKPMDLGTVKAKLDGNLYFDVDEFAADVRLTFANAMKYNPPSNDFHLMAKRLDNAFNQRWKLLEGKWKSESKKFSEECVSSGIENDTKNTRETFFKKSTPHANGLNKRSMPLEEKQKLKKELVDLLRGNVIKKMQNALQKFGLAGLKEEKVNLDLDKYDDDTLLELKRVVKAYSNLATEKAEPASVKQSGGHLSSMETVPKDSSTSSICSVNTKQQANIVACHLQGVDTHALPRNIPTERKPEKDHLGVARRDREVTNSSASVRNDLNSHGGRGILCEENSCSSPSRSTCDSTVTYCEGWDPLMNADLSPTKALRAAMLKSRFADTIIKAKQKSLPVDRDKADLHRMQQERAQLEKQQLEEKARIEAELKAAEVASRRKAEADLKMQRERQREAARIALQKMERTVEFEDNLKILRDLEKLCKCRSEAENFTGNGDGFTIILGDNPLERLGLCIKEDYLDDDEDAIVDGDWEDGEIL